jgi:hypothetical protein
MNHPIVNSKKNLLYYIIFWIVMSFSEIITNSVYNRHIQIYAVCMLASMAIYIPLSLSFWYPAKYIRIEKENLIMVIVSHAAASVISSALWLGLEYWIVTNFINVPDDFKTFFASTLYWRMWGGIFFYTIIVCLYYMHIYQQNLSAKVKKEYELNSLIKEAEFKKLKYQINPHFIFNSLNSISSLTISDPPAAQEMTVKLSQYMRNTLAHTDDENTTLKKEMENVKLYLDIEKVRFGDKFEFVTVIEPDCMNIIIPDMLFQPLIENAIKHGVYESLEKVTIKLEARRHGEYLNVLVENDYDPEAVSRSGEKVGLRNIKERLSLFFNQDDLVTIEDMGNIFRVKLFIPLEQ